MKVQKFKSRIVKLGFFLNFTIFSPPALALEQRIIIPQVSCTDYISTMVLSGNICFSSIIEPADHPTFSVSELPVVTTFPYDSLDGSPRISATSSNAIIQISIHDPTVSADVLRYTTFPIHSDSSNAAQQMREGARLALSRGNSIRITFCNRFFANADSLRINTDPSNDSVWGNSNWVSVSRSSAIVELFTSMRTVGAGARCQAAVTQQFLDNVRNNPVLLFNSADISSPISFNIESGFPRLGRFWSDHHLAVQLRTLNVLPQIPVAAPIVNQDSGASIPADAASNVR